MSAAIPWWWLTPKAFSPDQCAEIKAIAEKYPLLTGTVGHGGKTVVDEKIRKSNVRWLPRHDFELAPLFSRFDHLIQSANISAGWNYDLHGFDSIQFTQYEASKGGKYDFHADSTPHADAAKIRKLSLVCLLTNPSEFKGGQFEFEHPVDPLPDTHQLKQGDVLIFPSAARHRVQPLTKGVRHSLVCWAHGPPFR